jgi:hypothetical protein
MLGLRRIWLVKHIIPQDQLKYKTRRGVPTGGVTPTNHEEILFLPGGTKICFAFSWETKVTTPKKVATPPVLAASSYL